MTHGRRLLARVLGVQSGRVVAARCGVHPGCVSRWAAGHDIPSARAQLTLRLVYGIPISAWHPIGAKA